MTGFREVEGISNKTLKELLKRAKVNCSENNLKKEMLEKRLMKRFKRKGELAKFLELDRYL